MARSCGRVVSPSGDKPAAIAPEETTITSLPSFLRIATASTRVETAALSSPAPSLPVSDEEPILMTIRRAFVTASRITFDSPRLWNLLGDLSDQRRCIPIAELILHHRVDRLLLHQTSPNHEEYACHHHVVQRAILRPLQ